MIAATALAPSTAHTPLARVSLSEVLGALSQALDLTEGQPPGHTLRTCLIGMRIAADLGLDADTRSALYYALLLKDAGCSSNAARMCALFGSDDGTVKRRMKLVDWHDRTSLAVATARLVALGGSMSERARYFAGIARTDGMTRDLMQVRCERGASIAGQLGFPAGTSEAIRSLDEHWCGAGYPEGRTGDEIPLLARICNIAQVVEVYLATTGPGEALEVVRSRRGRWFDPALVDVVCSWERDREWWRRLRSPEALEDVPAVEPQDRVRVVDDLGLDAVAQAFADIIDAKTPFTFQHSTNVAAYAAAIGRHLGMPASGLRRLRRAGLLHDIGKLGVSNRILDKPGRLDAAERRAVEQHPFYSWQVLSRVRAFDDFAWMAALHHEKLDGRGYPWRLRGDRLEPAARILAVADIYEALTADRPYRAGMEPGRALGIVQEEVERGALCGDAATALRECVVAGTLER